MASIFQIVISAHDGATAVVRRINKEFNAVARPLNNLGSSIRSISRESGLTTLGKSLSGIAREAGSVAASLGQMSGPLQTIGGMAGAAGVASLAFRWGGLARQIDLTRRYTSMSSDEIQKWMGIAQLSGISVETMNDSLRTTSQLLQDMATGRNQNSMGIAQLLGISPGGLHEIRNVGGFLRQLHSSLDGKLPQEKIAALGQLGLQGLAPLMMKTNAEFDRYLSLVDKYAYVQGPEAVEQGKKFADSQMTLGLVLNGLAAKIGESLIPTFQRAIDGTRDWVDANKSLAASVAIGGGIVASIVGTLGTLGWLLKGIGAVARIAFTGVRILFSAIGIGISSLGLWIAELGSLTVLGPAVAGALTLIGEALFAVGAFLMGPWGIAIAAVAAGVYLIYDNWGKLKSWWKGLWGGMHQDVADGSKKVIEAAKNPMVSSGNQALGASVNPPQNRSQQMGIDAPATAFDNTGGNVDLSKAVGARRGTQRIGMKPMSSGDFGGPYAGGVVPLAPPPSKAQIEVLFKNAPAGMQATTNSSGSVDTSVRIQRAMPGQLSP